MINEKGKTHWLQSPNKKYLGHQDLPDGEDVILTILSAGWESVKNPITNSHENKLIIKFSEKDKWIKPLICNATNAKMFLKVTGQKFMEDCSNKKIKIGADTTKLMGDIVDCLRVRNVKSDKLTNNNTITEGQRIQLEEWAAKANKSIVEICQSMKIKTALDLPLSKFELTIKRLKELSNENS